MSRSLAEEWAACLIHIIPDNDDTRIAFYQGGRAVLTMIIDAIEEIALVDEMQPELIRINDELHDFAKKADQP